MNGGLGVQIMKGRQFIRFMHDLGIDLVPGYFTENAIRHRYHYILFKDTGTGEARPEGGF
jgi:hypothetical protein